MAARLFVSQAVLESWVDQRRMDFDGNAITLLAGEGKGRRYLLEPAVRFVDVAGEGVDAHDLLHRVKSDAQLRELGAERMGDSVILGEVAYEVEVGFLAERSALAGAVPKPP